MADEYKVTQAEFSDLTADMFMDDKFLGLLKKSFPESKVVSIGIMTSSEKGKIIQMFHPTPKSNEDRTLVVDSNNPEVFEKIASVITEFKG